MMKFASTYIKFELTIHKICNQILVKKTLSPAKYLQVALRNGSIDDYTLSLVTDIETILTTQSSTKQFA